MVNGGEWILYDIEWELTALNLAKIDKGSNHDCFFSYAYREP